MANISAANETDDLHGIDKGVRIAERELQAMLRGGPCLQQKHALQAALSTIQKGGGIAREFVERFAPVGVTFGRIHTREDANMIVLARNSIFYADPGSHAYIRMAEPMSKQAFRAWLGQFWAHREGRRTVGVNQERMAQMVARILQEYPALREKPLEVANQILRSRAKRHGEHVEKVQVPEITDVQKDMDAVLQRLDKALREQDYGVVFFEDYLLLLRLMARNVPFQPHIRNLSKKERDRVRRMSRGMKTILVEGGPSYEEVVLKARHQRAIEQDQRKKWGKYTRRGVQDELARAGIHKNPGPQDSESAPSRRARRRRRLKHEAPHEFVLGDHSPESQREELVREAVRLGCMRLPHTLGEMPVELIDVPCEVPLTPSRPLQLMGQSPESEDVLQAPSPSRDEHSEAPVVDIEHDAPDVVHEKARHDLARMKQMHFAWVTRGRDMLSEVCSIHTMTPEVCSWLNGAVSVPSENYIWRYVKRPLKFGLMGLMVLGQALIGFLGGSRSDRCVAVCCGAIGVGLCLWRMPHQSDVMARFGGRVVTRRNLWHGQYCLWRMTVTPNDCTGHKEDDHGDCRRIVDRTVERRADEIFADVELWRVTVPNAIYHPQLVPEQIVCMSGVRWRSVCSAFYENPEASWKTVLDLSHARRTRCREIAVDEEYMGHSQEWFIYWALYNAGRSRVIDLIPHSNA